MRAGTCVSPGPEVPARRWDGGPLPRRTGRAESGPTAAEPVVVVQRDLPFPTSLNGVQGRRLGREFSRGPVGRTPSRRGRGATVEESRPVVRGLAGVWAPRRVGCWQWSPRSPRVATTRPDPVLALVRVSRAKRVARARVWTRRGCDARRRPKAVRAVPPPGPAETGAGSHCAALSGLVRRPTPLCSLHR